MQMPAKKMTSVTTASKSFIEITNQNSQKDHQLPEWIDCYVVTNVDRRSCEPLSRELNNWQRDFAALVFDNSIDFPRIDHLKRIRRRPATTNEIELREKSEKVTLCEKKEVAVGGNDISAIANETNGSNDSSTTPGETNGEQNSAVPAKKRNNKKRNKSGDSPVAVATAPWALDLLIGSTAAIDYSIQTTKDNLSIRLHSILERYDIHPHSSVKKNIVTRRKLPGRPAKTKEERHEWNVSLWPTLFFEEQTLLYKEEQMMLTIEEMNMMRLGLKEAVNDAMVGRKQWNEWKSNTPYAAQIVGAVVMNPQTCSIVSRASDERRLQGMPENGCKQNNPTGEDAQKITTKTKSWLTFPDEANPLLCTPVIMAIQGVSRKERQIAMGCGMDSMEFQGGQGEGVYWIMFDVYLTKEPNVYEAMALVHSRVRRVVFGVPDREMGGLGGTTTEGIHSLPGTNHHYRAFRFNSTVNNCGNGEEEIAVLRNSLKQLHQEDSP